MRVIMQRRFVITIVGIMLLGQCYANPPLSLGANFLAARSSDAPFPVFTPASPCGAIGTKQFIMTGLVGAISFDRTGMRDQVLYTSNSGLFNFRETVLYDPQIRFDRFEKRFFAIAIDFNFDGVASKTTKLALAVSDGDEITPCTQWKTFVFPQDTIPPVGDVGAGIPNTDTNFATLGIDKHALYIGMNLYEPGTDVFKSAVVFVVQKQSLIDGSPVITAFRGLSSPAGGIFAPVGIDNFDNNPKFGYIIGKNINEEGKLIFYRISNPGSFAPTISNPISISVEQTAPPVNAPFKNYYGDLILLDLIDNRLQASHVRGNQLFTVRHLGVDGSGIAEQNFANNDRNAIRWTQLNLAPGGIENKNTVPDVVKEGTLFDNSMNNPEFFYFPSIMTNAFGLMTICGSMSKSNVAINAFASNRNINAPGNDNDALRNSLQMLTNGEALYFRNPFAELWGQYSYTSLDPVNNRDFWTVQPFVPVTSDYGIQVTQLKG